MILVFGSINVDLVARVAEIAKPGETVLSPGYSQFFGGKGANQAVAAARAARPGTRVLMAGAVGRDEMGDLCLKNLENEQIEIGLVAKHDSRTGCAFICVDAQGENAINVASGANQLLRAAELDDDLLSRVDIAILQMEVPLSENVAIADRLRSHGVPVILNFAPADTRVAIDILRGLLKKITYLVVNEHEVQVICSSLFHETSAKDPREAGAILSRETGSSVVVTLGSSGVILCETGSSPWHCTAVPVSVVDTTGAGDTFVGVLAAQLVEGVGIKSAINFANTAAALACTTEGAQIAMPSRSGIMHFNRIVS
ncbi:ribokinase [Rhizobium herbae]